MSINGNVSILSLVFMFISAVLSIVLPIAAVIWLAMKKRLKVKALLIAALLFIVFVLVLERGMHSVVLGANPQSSFILKNPLLYMLYGGFAAGIFEETARLIGLKFLLKVKPDESINTGISYGLGHGGIEAIIIAGLASISNITMSILINNGMTESILKQIPAAQLGATIQGMNSLISMQPTVFLLSGIERVAAIVVHISLTLFVFKAVKEKKWSYYFAAIVLHASVNFAPALYQVGVIKSIYLVEFFVFVLAVLLAIAAYKVTFSKKQQVEVGQADIEEEKNASLDKKA
ncbi:MAG: YhfC family glutamic-type intramembrane protease [Clostridia bacterium]